MPTPDTLTCTTCGRERDYYTVTRVFANKTKHVEAKCTVCKAHIRFLPQDQEPKDFIMPFGKYKGSTLGEILEEDRSYLEWVVKQDMDRRIITRVELLLG